MEKSYEEAAAEVPKEEVPKNVIGDGKNYKLSFVVEEQQSDQEYKIFKLLTTFTISFGFLILIFLNRLKKLTHKAEENDI